MTGIWGRRTVRIVFFVLVCMCVVCLPSATAEGGLRFRLALSYVNGVYDLVDQYEDNIEYEESDDWTETEVDSFVWPVGLSAGAYYQWENGLTVGAGIGPFVYIIAEGWGVVDDYYHWQIPLNATVGYVLGPNEPVSVYVRGGPSYHIAGGEYCDGSNIGLFGAVGLEFLKRKNVLLGVEAAYDTAEVDVDDLRKHDTKGIKAGEFSLGVFIVFK